MSKEYRQLMRRYAQEAPASPFTEEEIDRVVAQPRRPDGGGVPLRRWPVAACAALLLGAGAALLWPRGGEGPLVAEREPAPAEAAVPRQAPEPQHAVATEARHAAPVPQRAEVAPQPEEPLPEASSVPETVEYQPSTPASHAVEQIICYNDGVPVECGEEATIDAIMSFLS